MDYTWTVNTPSGSCGNPPMSALAVGHGFFMLLFFVVVFCPCCCKIHLRVSLRQNNKIRKRRFKVHAIFQARSSSLASLVGSSVDSEA